jgi:secreted trypsin-like serine protease
MIFACLLMRIHRNELVFINHSKGECRMKSKKLLKVTGVLVGLFMLAACGGGYDSDQALSSQDQPIINGSAPNAPMHDAVVSLHDRVGDTVYANIFCSGTLIAPDVVLTAAHCLDVGRAFKVRTMSPSDVAIYVGDDPINDPSPDVYGVIETLIHPAYDKRAITNDIALIRLGVAVDNVTPVAALPASLGFTSSDEGNLTLNFAGFGEDENGNYNVKLQFDGVLDHIQSSTQIYYTQYDGGPCFGDSGGPAFLYRNNTAYVGGITSYGDSYCAQYGVSTAVDAYETFINDFVGTTPPPEPEPDCSADGTCNPECAEGADPDCDTPPPPAEDPYCGDGICDGQAYGEDCDTCPADCSSIVHPKKGLQACCGNGICEKRESLDICAVDCL